MLEKQKLLQRLKARQSELKATVDNRPIRSVVHGDHGKLEEITDLINLIEVGLFDCKIWE